VELLTGHRAKLGPKQQEAIEALLRPGSVEDAAREIGITVKQLSGWMKNRDFMAAYRVATRAEHRQFLASLVQGPGMIVKSLLQIMYRGKKPAARLKAAREIIGMAGEALELEEYAAAVADAEGLVKSSQLLCQSAGVDGKARTSGHGAKLPRRAEQAIVALLGHRSVAEAARATGISAATLRRWLEDPAFEAKYAAAACAVFGPAMRLAQQREGDAVLLIKNFSIDPAVPEETRLKAVIYRAGLVKANMIANLESRLSGMEPAGPDTGEAPGRSQVIGPSLHQRLQQIKSRLLHAGGQSGIRRIILVHAVDGRAAGSSVAGPDGRHRWWDPPEGYKKDDLVKDDSAEMPEAA
jgi:transposase-like protein